MHPLDNPIFSALSFRQAHLAEGTGAARRYVNAISALAGFANCNIDSYNSLADIVPVGETAGLFVDEKPNDLVGWSIVSDDALLQLVFTSKKAEEPRHAFIELGDADALDMRALAGLTKPGPFGPRTHEFGGYIGVRSDGPLAAMAGYRMRVRGFTEISAICTHPDHLGRGLARSLTNALVDRILLAGETPFLHVRASNERAIQLYERLGFQVRMRTRYVLLKRT